MNTKFYCYDFENGYQSFIIMILKTFTKMKCNSQEIIDFINLFLKWF